MFCKRVRKKHGLIKTQKPCHKCGNIRHEWDLIMLKLLLVREIKTKNRRMGYCLKLVRMISASLFVIRLRIKKETLKLQTAIPTGKYTVIVTMSPKFKKELPLILNVPNFSGVRFMVAIMKTTARAALCFGMVRHMDAISNCACGGVSHKMIKEAKRSATNYCLIHVRERTSFMCGFLF